MTINITVSKRKIQEFIKKKSDKINELINKYNRKSLIVKEKKYIIPVIKIVVGALSTFLS